MESLLAVRRSFIPASFIGGSLTLPVPIYKSIVGNVLLYSAVRLFFSATRTHHRKVKPVPIVFALIIAHSSVCCQDYRRGGGIFLSPVLLLSIGQRRERLPASP